MTRKLYSRLCERCRIIVWRLTVEPYACELTHFPVIARKSGARYLYYCSEHCRRLHEGASPQLHGSHNGRLDALSPTE